MVWARWSWCIFWNDLQQEKRCVGGVEDVMLVEDTDSLEALFRVLSALFGAGVRKVVLVQWCNNNGLQHMCVG